MENNLESPTGDNHFDVDNNSMSQKHRANAPNLHDSLNSDNETITSSSSKQSSSTKKKKSRMKKTRTTYAALTDFFSRQGEQMMSVLRQDAFEGEGQEAVAAHETALDNESERLSSNASTKKATVRVSKRKKIDDIWTSQLRYNEEVVNPHGNSNAISTTKYTLLSWLPVSLIKQFQRFDNVYFLCLSILLIIGMYRSDLYTNPIAVFPVVGSLIVILMITSIVEGVEDLHRYNSDREENNKSVIILRQRGNKMQEEEIKRKDIQSGDVVKIFGGNTVPVDMALLMTSEHDEGSICFIETANIDGETNLKLRMAPSPLEHINKNGIITTNFVHGSVQYEAANADIHHFVGALKMENIETEIPLSAQNILLRGSRLSSSGWALGVAVYTGNECKVQMNSRPAPHKFGIIDRNVNMAVLIIFTIKICLIVLSLLIMYSYNWESGEQFPYLSKTFPMASSDSRVSSLPVWLELTIVFFLLYNNVIPISLHVTIVMVNIGQSFFLANDIDLYDSESDTPCKVNNSNLLQEFGTVTNIFSDKTGTLTANEMRLVNFYSNQHVFTSIAFSSNPDLEREKATNDPIVCSFFLSLALCHTMNRDSLGTLQAESPDELALLEGIEAFGYKLLRRSTTNIIISIQESEISYQILGVNAFNSDRKRMSLILKNANTNEYFLVCKGADSIMLDLCDINQTDRFNTTKEIDAFARKGLRTLCVTRKSLTEGQVNEWLNKYNSAKASIEDHDAKVDAVAAEIERDLELLGVTALEDRLQTGVPELINDFLDVGITVWMLTGDKEETAVQIGLSCNLCSPDSKLFFLTKCSQKGSARGALKLLYRTIVCKEQTELGLGKRLSAIEAEVMKQLPIAESNNTNANTDTNTDNSNSNSSTPSKHAVSNEEQVYTEKVRDEAKSIILSRPTFFSTQLSKILSLMNRDTPATSNQNDPAPSPHHTLGKKAISSLIERLTPSKNDQITLVLDGLSLLYVDLEDEEERTWLLEVAKHCTSVIACRLTPMQKQQLVQLVKFDLKKSGLPATTLAIGDGANDVSMIREADIGVGLSGKEGKHAANNADLSIAQFSFLRKVMFVHGRSNYVRSAKVFLYSIHKNMVITLTIFWFSFLCGMSGTLPYESFIYGLFNFALGWPIVFLGVMDRDVSDSYAIENPLCYHTGMKGTQLGVKVIGPWILNSITYAVIICSMCYVVLEQTFSSWGLFEMGLFVYNALVNCLQAKVCFMYHQWNMIIIFFVLLSVWGNYGVYHILSNYRDTAGEPLPDESVGAYRVADKLNYSSLYWSMSWIMIPFMTYILELITYAFRMFIYPSYELTLREKDKREIFDEDEIVLQKAISTITSCCNVESIGSRLRKVDDTGNIRKVSDITTAKAEADSSLESQLN